MEMGVDITERKRAEAALQEANERLEQHVAERTAALGESEERLRLAQGIARVGTFDWDIVTGVNTWTPELEAMYGLPPGGFANTQPAWESLVHPEDCARAVGKVESAFETGEPTEGEWRVVWPDGSIHWVAGRWRVFKDEGGQPQRMTGVNIDITERKRAEANQTLLKDVLQVLNRGGDLQPLVDETLRVVRRAMGFDAVGCGCARARTAPISSTTALRRNSAGGEFPLRARRRRRDSSRCRRPGRARMHVRPGPLRADRSQHVLLHGRRELLDECLA